MSDKKRRDITLGEMQDECSFRGHNCETIGGEPCKHYAICNQIRTKSCMPPEDWDLSDPPRFTEAQMALLEGLHAIGAESIYNMHGTLRLGSTRWGDKNTIVELLGLKDGEKVELGELFEGDKE